MDKYKDMPDKPAIQMSDEEEKHLPEISVIKTTFEGVKYFVEVVKLKTG